MASGKAGAACSAAGAAVAVFEADDVGQLGCTRLEDDGVDDRRHPMDSPRREVYGLARQELELIEVVEVFADALPSGTGAGSASASCNVLLSPQ